MGTGPVDRLHLTPLSRNDLPQYIDTGRRFFPNADWAGAPARLGAMMAKWDQGILAIRGDDGRIDGYYTLWPITPDAYEGFESGSLDDGNMGPERMPAHVRRPHRDWILTAIAVGPQERDPRRAIILSILCDFRARVESNRPCRVLAHAATEDGHRFLKRTGFVNSNAEFPDVYTLLKP